MDPTQNKTVCNHFIVFFFKRAFTFSCFILPLKCSLRQRGHCILERNSPCKPLACRENIVFKTSFQFYMRLALLFQCFLIFSTSLLLYYLYNCPFFFKCIFFLNIFPNNGVLSKSLIKALNHEMNMPQSNLTIPSMESFLRLLQIPNHLY